MEHRIHTAAECGGEFFQPGLVGEGGFVDADEGGREHGFQLIEPLFQPVFLSGYINGGDFSIQHGDALDLGKFQDPHLVIPVCGDPVGLVMGQDERFDLLREGAGAVDPEDDLLFLVFVDDECEFHGHTSCGLIIAQGGRGMEGTFPNG